MGPAETGGPGRDDDRGMLRVDIGKAARPPELTEVPFRLLVIGDFGRRRADRSPAGLILQGEAPASLPEQFDVTIDCSVENVLGSAPAQLDIRIPVRRLSGFSSRALNANIDVLQRAASFRQAVAAGYDDFSGFADFDKLIAVASGQPAPPQPPQQPAPPIAPASTNAAAPDISGAALLQSILDGGDDRAAGSQAAASDRAAAGLSSVIGAIARPQSSGHAARRLPLKERVAAVDALIAQQAGRIRAHARFAAIEGTWLGLQLLLRNAGKAEDRQIDLLDVPGDDTAQCLLGQVVADELEQIERAPLGAILVLGGVPGSVDGVERLAFCAAAGAALQVPVITSLQQEFFDSLDDDTASAWALLSSDDSHAHWLAACHGDLVLDADDRETPAWGEPGWAVAALVLASITRTGWPTDLVNPSSATVDGLAVYETATTRGASAAWPLRRPPTPAALSKLQALGVLTLAAQPNRDWVFLPAAPTVATVPVGGRASSLSDQLFAAFLLSRLHTAAIMIGQGSDAEVADAIRSRLGSVLAPGEFAARIDPLPREDPGAPRGFRIAVDARSPSLGHRHAVFDYSV